MWSGTNGHPKASVTLRPTAGQTGRNELIASIDADSAEAESRRPAFVRARLRLLCVGHGRGPCAAGDLCRGCHRRHPAERRRSVHRHRLALRVRCGRTLLRQPFAPPVHVVPASSRTGSHSPARRRAATRAPAGGRGLRTTDSAPDSAHASADASAHASAADDPRMASARKHAANVRGADAPDAADAARRADTADTADPAAVDAADAADSERPAGALPTSATGTDTADAASAHRATVDPAESLSARASPGSAARSATAGRPGSAGRPATAQLAGPAAATRAAPATGHAMVDGRASA
jgi:hypothetical protein